MVMVSCVFMVCAELAHVIVPFPLEIRMVDKNSSTVEFFDFASDVFSLGKLEFTKNPSSRISIDPFIKLYSKKSPVPFDPEVRKQEIDYHQSVSSCHAPSPYGFYGQRRTKITRNRSPHLFVQVINDSLVCVGNRKADPVGRSLAVLFIDADNDGSLSVKQSGNIGSFISRKIYLQGLPVSYGDTATCKSTYNRGMLDIVGATDKTRRLSAGVHHLDFRPIKRRSFKRTSNGKVSSSETRGDRGSRNPEMSGQFRCGRTVFIEPNDEAPLSQGKPSVDFSGMVYYDSFGHGALPSKGLLWLGAEDRSSGLRPRFIVTRKERRVK